MGKKRIYVALCLIALAMLGICFFYLKKTGWPLKRCKDTAFFITSKYFQ